MYSIYGNILGRGWDKQNTAEKECIKRYIIPLNTAEVQPLIKIHDKIYCRRSLWDV